jgi:hypothetical protein
MPPEGTMPPDLEEKIYRPGEDLSGIVESPSEKRKEIEALFAELDE